MTNNSFLRHRVVSLTLVIIITLQYSINPANADVFSNIHIVDTDTHSSIILDWNNFTTQLGIKEKLSPLEFSRLYALVHVSMYDSLLASSLDRKDVFRDNSTLHISSLAEAVSDVLIHLFPKHTDEITKLKSIQINELSSRNYNDLSMIEKGMVIGDRVSESIIAYSDSDNSDILSNDKKTYPLSNSTCIWNGSNPVNPAGGFWKTYILKSGSEIRPREPLPCNSDADLNDVKDTYIASKNRTPEQNIQIHFWADAPPPVIWNKMLNQQIQKYNMSLFGAAYSSVYLNVGMYDAFVSCWYTKYSYWTARPFQRMANISTEIPTPNFPSYTSGHSVISTVAGRVLSELFPSEAEYFKGKSVEAAFSRLLAGIHFKQDIVAGIDQGNEIADRVIDDMNKSTHRFVYLS